MNKTQLYLPVLVFFVIFLLALQTFATGTIKSTFYEMKTDLFRDYIHFADHFVRGKVTNSKGEPLVGVSITVKGTIAGTSTNEKGEYSIDVPENSTLVFSYVGFATKELQVNSRSVIDVIMEENASSLEQVVVVGYGEVQNKYLTGSVSSINGKELQNIPVSGLNKVLGGRAPGVEVTTVSGSPGASGVIRIRGGNSIQGNNNPLYVVDGVIMGQDYDLNKLNISDIQSVNVLKDATAVAIYGTRGSNGVVLITTKTGKSGQIGKPEVSFSSYTGVQTFVNNIDFLNGPQLAAYANEDATYRGAGLPFLDPTNVPNTDWIGLLTHNAPLYNANVAVSGTSSDRKLNYYLSGGYFNQDGIIINSGFEKYNFTTNLDFKLSNHVSMGLRGHITYMHLNNNKVNFSGGEGSLLHGIIPVRSIYDSLGQFTAENPVSATLQSNPIADTRLKTDYTNSTNILVSLYLQVSPVKNLVFKSTFSPVLDYNKHNFYNPGLLPEKLAINAGGDGGVNFGTTVNLLNENTITYSNNFGTDHKIDLLGGFTWQTEQSEGINAHGYAYFNDDQSFNNLGAGADPTRNAIGSDYDSYQLVSWLGRANYTFKNKYLLTLVARADGSSRFAPGNKYSFFPAAALAWRLDQESFIKDLNVFDNLKIKASYGLSGSQSIPSFRTLPILSAVNTTFNGVEQPGVTLGRPANPELKWETTNELDIGLSAVFFKGRLSFDMDYYNKETKDLLLNMQIPRQTGFNSKLQNIGSIRNKGLDITITSENISNKNFKWSTTLNVSGNRNKALNLGGVDHIDLITPTNQGGVGGRLIIGETVPVFVGVDYLGTWKTQADIDASGLKGQRLGGPHFDDTNGDKQISIDDFKVLGSPQPDFYGGLQNTFGYKNFVLDIFIQGSYGNEIFNTLTQTAFFGRGAENKYAITLNRWTPDNPTSDIPRAGTVAEFSAIYNNSYEIEDGSYLRLKSLQLTYNLPVKKWGSFGKVFKDMSVFFSGENLLLFSHFKLFDPETSKYGNGSNQYSNILAGYADGAYPYAKTYTVGIKASL
jgi:TonB-linked SusC/RagA family outer membrane protein